MANPITMKAKYFSGQAEVIFPGVYMDGALAMRIVSPDGEPLFTATVCLVEYGYTPPTGYVAIKNYSENEGVMESLIEGGYIERPRVALEGPDGITFPVCALTEKAAAALLGMLQ